MRDLQEIINLDDRIYAVLHIEFTGKVLNSVFSDKFEIKEEVVKQIITNFKYSHKSNLLGNHIWDISEFDNIRVIRIYEANEVIMILSKSNIRPEEVSQILFDYFEINNKYPESLF